MKIKFCHLIDGANFNPLLYNSIKYSDHEKFEYTVVSLEPAEKLQEQMAELGVRSFSVNHTSRKQAPSTFWEIYRLFRREKFEIVQAHLFDSSLIGLAAARAARVPVRIFTGHHSGELALYGRPFLTFLDGVGGRWLANHAIAPSSSMKDVLVSHQKVPGEKIEVVHHGFDLDAWRAGARRVADVRQEFGLGDKIVFGAVGRLFWIKDFENLIRAFAAVAKERSDVALLIVGGGDRTELQKTVDECRLRDKVILAGRREDIAAVMNQFDVFVHSSLAESFGMVFIEVFALGKPVISTSVGVAPDIIENGENGFLVSPGRPEEMARAMLAMLERKQDWEKMGETNRRLAENFAVRKTQALCDEFYLKWLKEKEKN